MIQRGASNGVYEWHPDRRGMSRLISYNKEVSSIFELLGNKENDITLSMSWVLMKCPEFLRQVIMAVVPVSVDPEDVLILNQRYTNDTGITDIEITDKKTFHIIFEAKRGWVLPGAEQLTKYSLRKEFVCSQAVHKVIVTLSECTELFADMYLPFTNINGIPVRHLSWKRIYELAEQSKPVSNHEQKHLLSEFTTYLRGIMTMQKLDSNMVYVVALGSQNPDGCPISWIEIVQRNGKYFCPIGVKGWPKEPPNYIAFRYYGKLQSIHHIEDYTVSRNMHAEISEMPDQEWDGDCFIYHLGPAIIPGKTVKTGNIYRNGRVWAMLDLLLTCDSISDARDQTQARLR